MRDRSRPVQQGGRRPAGYPSLRGAWRILAGAVPLLAPALAHADATVPAPHKAGEKPKLQSKGDIPVVKPPVTPSRNKPVPVDFPEMGGVIAAPEMVVLPSPPPPPKPAPQSPLKPAPVPVKKMPRTDGDFGARVVPPSVIYSERGVIDAGTGIVLHPHAPGEPCFKRTV